MIYTSITVQHRKKAGDEIWACAYEETADHDGLKFVQQPIRGVLLNCRKNADFTDSYEPRYFVPYKLNSTTPVKSKTVGVDSRWFADSESECQFLYNSLIQQAAEWHKVRITEIESNEIMITGTVRRMTIPEICATYPEIKMVQIFWSHFPYHGSTAPDRLVFYPFQDRETGLKFMNAKGRVYMKPVGTSRYDSEIVPVLILDGEP